MGIRIVVYDKSGIVHYGLSSLLIGEPDFLVVGKLESMDHLEQAALLHADILLLDLDQIPIDSLEFIQNIKKQFPEMRILIMTALDDPSLLINSLAAGATGYILYHTSKDELLAALHAVACGGLYVAASMAHPFLQKLKSRNAIPNQDEYKTLSLREKEVLGLIAKGQSNQEIAENLGISQRTVISHRMMLKAKLKVESLKELKRYAVDHLPKFLP